MQSASLAYDYQRASLPNGLRVLVVPMPQRVSFSASFSVKVGSRDEREGEVGIAHFLEHMTFKGGRRWTTAQSVSAAIEEIGGVINAATDREETSYWAKVPAHSWTTALDVLADIVTSPHLADDEIPKEKHVVIEEIRMYRDSPQDYVEALFDEALWPHHALGRDIAGDEESVMQITPSKVRAFHASYYIPGTSVLCVAGACDPSEIIGYVTERLAGFESRPEPTRRPPDASTPQSSFVWNPRSGEQANVILGYRGVSYRDDARFGLDVLQTILGSGMSSRLFQRIREEEGLVYDIHSSMTNYSDGGDISFAFACDPERVYEAIQGVFAVIQKLLDDGIPEKELRKAKDYLLGHLELGMEDTGAVSEFFGEQALLMEKLLQPSQIMEKVEAVTSDQVLSLAQRYLGAQRVTCAIDGPLFGKERVEDTILAHNSLR